MDIVTDDIEDYHGRIRLRSERRRKRAAKEAYDKDLLQLGREWQDIRRKLYNIGWDELNPPIQRGYVRFFVLRDDIKRTKQAGFFEKILAKINVRQYSHRKDFLIKRRRYGKKIYVPREHTLPVLEGWQLWRLKLTPEERVYFSEETVYSARLRRSRVVYRFTEPWRFVLRIQLNMITKVRKKDVDLERRHAALNHYFSVDNHRVHWVKLVNGSTYKSYTWLPKHPTPEKYISPLHNRSFHDILSEYYPEPPLRITHKNPQPLGIFLLGKQNASDGSLSDATPMPIARKCRLLCAVRDGRVLSINHSALHKHSSAAVDAAACAPQKSSATRTVS